MSRKADEVSKECLLLAQKGDSLDHCSSSAVPASAACCKKRKTKRTCFKLSDLPFVTSSKKQLFFLLAY